MVKSLFHQFIYILETHADMLIHGDIGKVNLLRKADIDCWTQCVPAAKAFYIAKLFEWLVISIHERLYLEPQYL